jgi:hypothetical protein
VIAIIWMIIFSIVFIFTLAIWNRINQRKQRRDRQTAICDEIKSLPDFTVTEYITGAYGYTGLAFDEGRKTICLIDHDSGGVSHRIISNNELLSVEIFEDGDSITKTDRVSQMGGAILGGLALGGVGAIIGGLSGTTKNSSKIRRVDLRLVVNDTAHPLHDLMIYVEGERDGIRHGPAVELARHWHGIIEVLIKRAEAEERANHANLIPQIASPPSVADEIRKLADLFRSEMLTAEEFKHQKAKLLGMIPQPTLSKAS